MGAGLDTPRREALETPRREPRNPPPRWTVRPRVSARACDCDLQLDRLDREAREASACESSKNFALTHGLGNRWPFLVIAVMWWAACSHLPVLPQPAGRLFIFAGLRAPYLWMFPWGQLFGANSAARANYLQTRREPTIWSQGQLRHPRQPFGDRSRATIWSQLCRPRYICGATPGMLRLSI